MTAALVVAANTATAAAYELPRRCVMDLPNKECGEFLRSGSRMSYTAGPCTTGKPEGRIYRAKSIKQHGNTLTIDGNATIVIKWMSPDKRSARIDYVYVDKFGDRRSGSRNLTCR